MTKYALSTVRVSAAFALLVLVATASSANAAKDQTIHHVRWNGVVVPGSVCGATGPIHLRDGSAVVASTRWRAWPKVTVYREEHVAYGDLDGDGLDEAGFGVVCSNGGGTAAGQLAFAQVIFRLEAGRLHVVGIVTPRHLTPSAPHVPLVTVQIVPGRVIATEYFYGPHDGDCCASGRARTIWRYSSSKLHPGRPVITRPGTK